MGPDQYISREKQRIYLKKIFAGFHHKIKCMGYTNIVKDYAKISKEKKFQPANSKIT